MAGTRTGELAVAATAKKKRNTPHPNGARASAGVDMPTPMPHIGMPGMAQSTGSVAGLVPMAACERK
ncbi:hypothetical protein SE17_14255 [Kouleothrix aurantiaca]|uniref:Uncharacterized protein n=1 Tax=Kouleothrix aurantiaca TaxID=186479 RepID=A0A0P9HDG5_9CHLR|nr:hypothetical protein SE17_14255 [Kouleothrix aurantiaca]